MENFNKLISFILGLVVVVVFLLIISGKIDIRKKLISQKTTPTPTPIENQSYQQEPTPTIGNTYQKQTTTTSTYQKTTAQQIPATGSPTILLPFMFSGLGLGVFIKKKTNE